MRVLFRLLFVGWWMAGQSWMENRQSYPAPSVSVSPEVVPLGGDVTVCCSTESYGRITFFLNKVDLSLPRLLTKTANNYKAEFIISINSSSDTGIYQCMYRLEYDPDIYDSLYSDDIHINVTDPSIPKPSIKVKPEHQNALGSSITLECQGQEDGLSFLLRKASTGEISRAAAPPTATASFRFHWVRPKDAGGYICQYHRKSTPFVWSEPSDPVELILKDPSLSQPSIRVRPEGQHEVGANVTIECKGPENGLTFSLHKSKNLSALQTVKAEGNTAKFSLSLLRREDAGNYTCQYYHRRNLFVYSERSDPAQVVVTDLFPKNLMTVIWASVAAGLLLALVLLVLILVLCKKRRKRSTVKEGNQPVNTLLEQNAGMGQDERADHDGITYAELNQHALKTEQPASQHAGPESCIYAPVANERSRKV